MKLYKIFKCFSSSASVSFENKQAFDCQIANITIRITKTFAQITTKYMTLIFFRNSVYSILKITEHNFRKNGIDKTTHNV